MPIVTLIAILIVSLPAMAFGETLTSEQSTSTGPRKVVVATSIFKGKWQGYPGLDERLKEIGQIIDRSAAEAQERYGRGLDLLVMTEYAVGAGMSGSPAERAFDFDGQLRDYLAAKAREHRCYLVMPMILAEDRQRGIYTNSAIVINRDGEPVGVYRKMFPVASRASETLEGGITPGREAPVIECDFGRIGIQICYDMSFDEGWDQLAENDAEIVLWPSASPQTFMPALRARRGDFYVVSATMRDNAAVYDPLGQVVAQINDRSQSPILVTEVDLDYLTIDWQPELQDGAVFRQAYGDRVGYRYSRIEDAGLFWSNDPQLSIHEMVEKVGLDPRVTDWPAHTLKLRKEAMTQAPPLSDTPWDQSAAMSASDVD